MNNNNTPNSVSNNRSLPEVPRRDAVTTTESRPIPDDEPTATNSTERHGPRSSELYMNKFLNEFKSYILSSEDDAGIQFAPNKDFDFIGSDREPMFVIVDSSCISNPSSKELLVDNRINANNTVLKKHYTKNVTPVDIPSTSRDIRSDVLNQQLKESDSTDEMQVMDINLQSDNELSVGESDGDSDSIVLSYLRNKDAFLEMEEWSETSLDVFIPSFPGSPREISGQTSAVSLVSADESHHKYKRAIEFLHSDNELLIAAEMGDEIMTRQLINEGVNIHDKDHLGRTALHFAVCSGNRHVVAMLLNAGIDPNIKDNVGMTPLSLCLMRRPSWRTASLLFNHGAVLLTRMTPMDTGLFLQFVMMCIPTREEERILRLLVDKGALVNDPEAPGKRQALHFAAMSNNCRLIAILVDLGADVHAKNHRNETPKEVAATFKCRNALTLLEDLEGLVRNYDNSSMTIEEGYISSDMDTSV